MVTALFRFLIPGLLLVLNLFVLLTGAALFPQPQSILVTGLSILLAITLMLFPISLADWSSGDLLHRLPKRLKSRILEPPWLILSLIFGGLVAIFYYPWAFTVIATLYFPPIRGWEVYTGLAIGALVFVGYLRGAYLCVKWYQSQIS